MYYVDATMLVGLLLELNVINVQDIDRELNKLAAGISDPRAVKWFKRVVRYFLINIEQLIPTYYRVTAKPRGAHTSKYHLHPELGWIGHKKPEQEFTQTREVPLFTPPGASAPPGSIEGKPRETGTESPAGFYAGSEAEPHRAKKKHVAEAAKKKKPAQEPSPEPDPEGVYTTDLRPPVFHQGHLDTSFDRFYPKKAKASSIHGGPPSKEKLQPWMTAAGTEKEFHHFDPIQVRRRELFGNLEYLVHYLNWKHRLLAKASSDNPEEKQAARETELFFRGLEVMPAADIAGFRQIMQDALDFKRDVRERPWTFSQDGKTISAHGPYTIKKVIHVATSVAMTKRLAEDGSEPQWCTDMEGHATTYLEQNPLYFVDRNDYPYILVHWGRINQANNLMNTGISDSEGREIAPLFTRLNVEVSDHLLRTAVEKEQHTAGSKLAAEILRLRGRL